MRRRCRGLGTWTPSVVLMATAWIGPATWALEPPETVSPGEISELAPQDDVCPTFSWSGVAGVESVELLVYRLEGEQDEPEDLAPVLHRTLPGSASSWTPSLDSCLERGGRYAWMVRVGSGEELSEWSAPGLFEILAGPSEEELEAALRVVQRYLDSREGGEILAGAGESSGEVGWIGPSLASIEATAPAPRTVTAGEPALVVNGSPVVTVATLSGALCGMTRFLDQGDGTVLDCNTGLYWLKDARCVGDRDWPSAVAFAASLEDGDCGLSDGSVAGQWRLPTILEFCNDPGGPESLSSPCMPQLAIDSLANTAFSDPVLSNARGDAPWSEGDAFIRVNASMTRYWSATDSPGNAFTIDFANGVMQLESIGFSYQVWPVRDALP